jgi:hypothetical protein
MKANAFAKATFYTLHIALLVLFATVCFYLSNVFAESLRNEFLQPIAKVVSFISFFSVALVIVSRFNAYLGRLIFPLCFKDTGRTVTVRAGKLINPGELDFARNVAKRLDEHRELVIDLVEKTDYLAGDSTPWRISHLATQDDYLMYLFFLRYGIWPNEPGAEQVGYCRPRPALLGECTHPLYKQHITQPQNR